MTARGFARAAAMVLAASAAHAGAAAPPQGSAPAGPPAHSPAVPASPPPTLREASARTREVLAKLPGREALAARIRALEAAAPDVRAVRLAAGRVFYLKRVAPAPAVLCVRDGLDGAERVLLDPRGLARAGEHAGIAWFAPSPDARHVAYGIARGARGEVALRVRDVERGTDLPLEIDRAARAAVAWDPDGRAFYYARAPEADSPAMRGAHARVYRHALGGDAARDEVVFAPGVGGAREVPTFAAPRLLLPPDSRLAYALVRDGVRRELAVYASARKALAAGRPRWHRLAGLDDGVVAVRAWRNDLYLLSHARAARREVLRVEGDAADLSRARVAVPEGESIIEDFVLARDAIYLRTMVAGVDRLERAPLGLLRRVGPPEFLRIPFDTAITELVGAPRRAGVLLRLEGWIEPPAIYSVDARGGDLHDTGLQPASPLDYSAFDEVRLYATAADGTRIPVTLVYRKATRLTGDNPTLLAGFGSYGALERPRYDPGRLAWLERGGVFAVAHVRGGGEYGDAWHAAGTGARKATAVSDFLAAARYVVRYGFTRPARLAILGRGAGGIVIAGAMARQPALFGAVVLRDAYLDLARYEEGAGGPENAPEFGSAATPAGREALRALSPYAQVREGTAYPAVLLVASAAGPGVPSWHSARMAERLRGADPAGKPVLLRVDFGASGAATSPAQRTSALADIYSFVLWQAGDADFQPPAPPPPPPPPLPAPPPAPPPKPEPAFVEPPGG